MTLSLDSVTRSFANFVYRVSREIRLTYDWQARSQLSHRSGSIYTRVPRPASYIRFNPDHQDAKTTLFIVNSELSQSLDNWYFSSSSVSRTNVYFSTRREETNRDETRRGKETERWSALKGKSFKLRERKKNAFLLIPDKYVGKRAVKSAALCLRSNGFVKLYW